jgi:hypothetical protein
VPPAKFELATNLKSVKALSLEICAPVKMRLCNFDHVTKIAAPVQRQLVKAAFGRPSSYHASEFGNNGTNHPRTQLACIKEDAKMRHAKPPANSQQD